MIKLIKNELFKIVKQKSTLILLLILLAVMVLNNIMTFTMYDKEGNQKNAYSYIVHEDGTEEKIQMLWRETYAQDVEMIEEMPEEYRGKIEIEKKSLEDDINYLKPNTSSAALVDVTANDLTRMFMMVICVVIAGGVVANEFNKGTIKMLLVKPYSRMKILLAKYIAVLVLMLVIILIALLFQLLLGTILFGPDTFASAIAEYSYTTNEVIMINTFAATFLNVGVFLIMLILIVTLAFALSAVTQSSAIAIALPILGWNMYGIINMLAEHFDWQFMKYFVSLSWDFREFLFGAQNTFAGITIQFASVICFVYWLIMLIPTFMKFQKQDITNQ